MSSLGHLFGINVPSERAVRAPESICLAGGAAPTCCALLLSLKLLELLCCLTEGIVCVEPIEA